VHRARYYELLSADAKSFLDAFFNVFGVQRRKKSDFRYSAIIVYNNFPWPLAMTPSLCQEERTQKLQRAIETAAQAVLGARVSHTGAWPSCSRCTGI
jgi:hypothetical protein